jgi:hypothetical protein
LLLPDGIFWKEGEKGIKEIKERNYDRVDKCRKYVRREIKI